MKPLLKIEELKKYADFILLLKRRRKSDMLARFAMALLKFIAGSGTRQYAALVEHLKKADPKGSSKFTK